MRYLVEAKLKVAKQRDLVRAIDNETLGRGSIAGDEYLHNMNQARVNEHGIATWVECCFCDPPLAEEHPTGKNSSIWSALKTPIPGAIVGTKTGLSRGHAASAVARRSWKRNSH